MKHQELSTLQQYMSRWPYIVVYQHQGMNVSMWQQLRLELGDTMECMVVKNSQAVRVLNSNHLCNGSICFIGTSSMDEIKLVESITKKYEYSLLTIGGFWDNKCWTHYDIQRICNLDSVEHVWINFISTISQENTLVKSLTYTNELCTNTIKSTSNSLCNILQIYSTY
jgi:ribosomal protein L10